MTMASFIELASLIAKRVDQQKSKMELEAKALGAISLIDTVTLQLYSCDLIQVPMAPGSRVTKLFKSVT